MFSMSIFYSGQCPVCRVCYDGEHYLRVEKSERPDVWARARRGALNEQVCGKGHRFFESLPAILHDTFTGRSFLVTTIRYGRWRRALEALHGATDDGVPERYEIIPPQELATALQSLEFDIALGHKHSNSFTSDLIDIGWALPYHALLASDALEPPTLVSARSQLERCVHLMAATPAIDARVCAQLSAQAGRCRALLGELDQACIDLQRALRLLGGADSDFGYEVAMLKVSLAEALLADGIHAPVEAKQRAVGLLDAAQAVCDVDAAADADRAEFTLLHIQAHLLAAPSITSAAARALMERLLHWCRRIPKESADWHAAARLMLDLLAVPAGQPIDPDLTTAPCDLLDQLQEDGRWRELADVAARMLREKQTGIAETYLLTLQANGLVRQTAPADSELRLSLQLAEDALAVAHESPWLSEEHVADLNRAARDIFKNCFTALTDPDLDRENPHAGFCRMAPIPGGSIAVAVLLDVHVDVACRLIAKRQLRSGWRALVRADELAFHTHDDTLQPIGLALNLLLLNLAGDRHAGEDFPPAHAFRQVHQNAFFDLPTAGRQQYLMVLDRLLLAVEQADFIPLAVRLHCAVLPYFRWVARQEKDADRMVSRLEHLAMLACDCEEECTALGLLSEAHAFVDMGLVPRERAWLLLIRRAGALSALRQYGRAELLLSNVLAEAPPGAIELSARHLLAGVLVRLSKFDAARAELATIDASPHRSTSTELTLALLRPANEGYAALAKGGREEACRQFDRALEVALTTDIPLGMYVDLLGTRVGLMLEQEELDAALQLVDMFGPLLRGEGYIADRCPHLRASALGIAADVTLAEGKYWQAFNLLRTATELDYRHCAQRLAYGLSTDRRQLLREYRNRAELLAGLVAEYLSEDAAAVGCALETVGRFKAIDLQVERLRLAVLRNACSRDEDKKQAWHELGRLREQLGVRVVRGETDLQAMLEALEHGELAITPSAELAFSIEEAMHEISLAAMRRENADAPLIDVMRCDAFFDMPAYLAFLLAPDQTVTVRVLGDCASIDLLVEKFSDSLQRKNSSQTISMLHLFTPNAGAELRELLIDPWRDRLEPYQHLVWCLDGPFSRVPLECLPYPDGQPLLSRYSCSYVSAPQRLSFNGIIKYARQPQEGPVVIGDPQFEEGADAAFTCASLPGARDEAQMIASLLATEPHLGTAANKHVLLNARGPEIVHVASHGYSLPAPKGAESRPLLGAGLLFAGANAIDLERSAAGILSAEEALFADMEGTALAVLSACHTAAGPRIGNDNLAGLAHAFEAAGVQSLIAGLWRVPDEPTRMLMTEFYARLRDGRNLAQALREAKLEVRARYATFDAWGAFILIGKWQPMNLLKGQRK